MFLLIGAISPQIYRNASSGKENLNSLGNQPINLLGCDIFTSCANKVGISMHTDYKSDGNPQEATATASTRPVMPALFTFKHADRTIEA